MEENPVENLSVHVVWMPMFPRPQERWSLPDVVEDFAAWGKPQYWDDERKVSLEVKTRLVQAIDDEVPWDLFVFFGPEATWSNAHEHVLGWGEPIVDATEDFEALVRSISQETR